MGVARVALSVPVPSAEPRAIHKHLSKILPVSRHDLKRAVAVDRRETARAVDILFGIDHEFARHHSAILSNCGHRNNGSGKGNGDISPDRHVGSPSKSLKRASRGAGSSPPVLPLWDWVASRFRPSSTISTLLGWGGRFWGWLRFGSAALLNLNAIAYALLSSGWLARLNSNFVVR